MMKFWARFSETLHTGSPHPAPYYCPTSTLPPKTIKSTIIAVFAWFIFFLHTLHVEWICWMRACTPAVRLNIEHWANSCLGSVSRIGHLLTYIGPFSLSCLKIVHFYLANCLALSEHVIWFTKKEAVCQNVDPHIVLWHKGIRVMNVLLSILLFSACESGSH